MLAKKYDISIQHAYKIAKAKDSLSAVKNALSMYSKISARYPDIDRAVFEWFCSIRAFHGTKKQLPVELGTKTIRFPVSSQERFIYEL